MGAKIKVRAALEKLHNAEFYDMTRSNGVSTEYRHRIRLQRLRILFQQ